MADMKNISKEAWKKKLTPEQYQVMFGEGIRTEPPWSGKYVNYNEKGAYQCAACGNSLFTSDHKYESVTPGLEGWPSFYDIAEKGNVILRDDDSFGMHRTEVICANCGAHLGHVFEDDYDPTLKDKGGMHYCINSCSLTFTPKK